jgi:hypothetical protein
VDNFGDNWFGIVRIDQDFCCESMKLRREAMHWDSILDGKHDQMAENFFINLSQFHSRLRGIVKKTVKRRSTTNRKFTDAGHAQKSPKG